MSQKELQPVKVIENAAGGRLSVSEAARPLSVVQTVQRQFWRCSTDARSSGIGEVAHGKDLWPGWRLSVLVAPKEKSHEEYGLCVISPVQLTRRRRKNAIL